MTKKAAKSFNRDKDLLLSTNFYWHPHQRYEIEDGWIIPYDNPGVDYESYAVFDYYLNTLDGKKTQKKLLNVLGHRTVGTSKLHLHTLFMSLDTSNQDEIIGWCKEFGLPSHPIAIPSSKKTGYPLKKFIDEVHLMRFAWECFNALQTLDDAPILKVLQDNIHFCLDQTNENSWVSPLILAYYDPDPIPEDALRKIILDLPIDRGQEAVATLINKHIAGIVPEVVSIDKAFESTSLALSWKIDDLSSAIWMMFAEDLSGRRTIKTCDHPKCSFIFATDDSSQKYCSGTCNSRQKQADYRMREKLFAKIKQAFETKDKILLLIKDGSDRKRDSVTVLDVLVSDKKRIIKFRSFVTDMDYQLSLDEIIDVQMM